MTRVSLLLAAIMVTSACSGGIIRSVKHEASSMVNTSTENPVYCVLLHSPGPNWQAGVPFREQPGVMEHVQYMRQQLEAGLMVMGGPYLDDTGGMMIFSNPDLEQARAVANADPAVQSGLLNVQVKLWMVPMSTAQPTPHTGDVE